MFREHGDGVLSADGCWQLLVRLASIVDHDFRVTSTAPGEGHDTRALRGSTKGENQVYFEAWFNWDMLRKAEVEIYRESVINDKAA